MSEHNEREAIAKALYMEFRSGAYTYQVVAAPVAVSLDKKKVFDAGLVHRRISHWSPRRNWRFSGWGMRFTENAMLVRTPMGDLEQIADPELLNEAAKPFLSAIEEALSTLGRRGFTLTKKPIAVEMSEKDYKSFEQNKLSADLYRRITRSRIAFDYPEDVFEVPEATPETTTV